MNPLLQCVVSRHASPSQINRNGLRSAMIHSLPKFYNVLSSLISPYTISNNKSQNILTTFP